MENVICGVSMLLVVILLAKNTNLLTNFAQRKTKILRFFGRLFNSNDYFVEIYLTSVS